MEIYQPAEDSYFFVDFLKKYFKNQQPNTHNPTPTFLSSIKMLDMGTGSGILSETASQFINKKNIIPVDINPKSVKLLKQKGFNAVKSNLFQNVKSKFNLIIFNAPYLPLDKREPKSSQVATTGGKNGDEISIKFLKQAKNYLTKNGKIFLLISTLTPMGKIKKFNPKIVARKKIFMEELLILEL
ncbi:MAG: HemK2/MTQ2 family protein methyltransferase [archaeon]